MCGFNFDTSSVVAGGRVAIVAAVVGDVDVVGVAFVVVVGVVLVDAGLDDVVVDV